VRISYGKDGLVAILVAPILALIWPGSILASPAPALSLDSVPTLVIFTPVSVEWDPRDQTLWVADQYLPRIAHANAEGAPLAVFAASRYGGGRPAGVALDASGAGHLFISDPDASRIVRVDLAGNPAGEFGTAGLGLGNPADLAWDVRDGSLFVADPTARAVFHLAVTDANADGNPDGATLMGSFSTIPLGSDNPMGLALDPASGHLFLSDPALDRVFELDASGGLIASFDTGVSGGTSVTGLAWEGPGGRLHLADAARKLLVVTPTGSPVAQRGTAPFGTLSPQGLAWDPTSATLLSVSGERKMVRFAPELPGAGGGVDGIFLHRQELTTTFGSIAPVGIALDAASGDRYVADAIQRRVFRVDAKGSVVSSFDTAAAGATAPTGIAPGPAGAGFYVTDSAARRVFQISSSGSLLSSFSTSPFKHKPQGEPLCNDPQGITYDASLDHFFVVDALVARITEITRTGDFVASFSTASWAGSPTDLAVDPAANRLIVSDSTGRFVEFTRSGALLTTYPGVPLRFRLSGVAGAWVEPATLQRVLYNPTDDVAVFLSRTGAALSQISLEPYGLRSPSGAAWLASAGKLYVLDQQLQRLYAVTPGPDGAFGTSDDVSSWLSTAAYGSVSPKGIALNQSVGKVGWVDETTARLYWANFSLAYLGSIDLSPAGATAPRGVDQDPTSANVFSSDPVSGLLISSSGGNPVQGYPWSTWGIADPGGVGLSPAEGILLAVDRAARSLVAVDLSTYFLPEVTDLSFTDPTRWTWTPRSVFASYQLFRGDLQLLPPGGLGGCYWVGPSPPAFDPEDPTEGSGWFYLVAGKNMTGVGSLGTRGDGLPRSLDAISPACP
jgi:DNA-binding beta-propeller fold protein YncE